MIKIFDYCVREIDKLSNYYQEPFEWKSKYNIEEFFGINQFNQVVKEIPGFIDRNEIIKSIQSDKYYKAFIEIMFWGQVGARPGSNKSKRTEIATKIFSHDIEKIISIFKITMNGKIEEIKELYHSLEHQGLSKIPEVDVSYFTKLLSFASEASKSEFKLLIYDKWTKLLHVHLLFDANEIGVLNSFYTKESISKLYSKSASSSMSSTKLIYPRSGKSYEVYLDYCQRMNQLASQISNQTEMKITPFLLEGFLFGQDLKGKHKKIKSNPRYWIQQNFASNYLPKVYSL